MTEGEPRGNVIERLRRARREVRDRGELTRFIDDCRKLLTERGEANSVAIAQRALERYASLSSEARLEFFGVLAEAFDPDPAEVLEAAQRYATERSPQALVALQQAAEPARQELLRRLNGAPGGAAALVRMRAELLERARDRKRFAAVDHDFHHLFSSWFNPGFLRLERIDWRSPALLLEQLIRHEAVHEIDGWNDLRRRLQPDRRCFAFFHPVLSDEPLIFVEVALLPSMPDAIAPLIDKQAEPLDPARARVATFYSISNCQPGLRGVSLGNFLIKRVAEALQAELPALKTFCTLSPVPSFTRWLGERDELRAEGMRPQALNGLRALREGMRDRVASGAELTDADRKALQRLCAFFLVHGTHSAQRVADPVARFHLNNGARLERINVDADRSRKGMRESVGLMVNYLYDLDDVEANHERFVNGEAVASRQVRAMVG